MLPLLVFLVLVCAASALELVRPPASRSFEEPVQSSDVSFRFDLKDFLQPPRAAEYHCISDTRVFVIAGSGVLEENTVHVYDILASNMTYSYVGELNVTIRGESLRFGEPNSCNVAGGKVYVVVTPFKKIGLQTGKLMVYNASSLALLQSYDTGYNPDMVGLTAGYAVVANEGEPQLNNTNTVLNYPQGVAAYNPIGGVTILSLTALTTCTLDFHFDISEAVFQEYRIHNDQPATVNTSFSIEPEYIAFDPQRPDRAFVVCQEANVIVEVLLTSSLPCTLTSRVVALRPLGLKSYRLGNNKISPTDKDLSGIDMVFLNQSVFSNQPVFGLYQPDGCKGVVINGETYFITANEGDGKSASEYGDGDEKRVRDNAVGAYSTNADWLPHTSITNMRSNSALGRLKMLSNEGRNVSDANRYYEIWANGGRSFSLWKFNSNTNGSVGSTDLVFDSGHFTDRTLQSFMSESSSAAQITTFLGRLDDKGAEPEGVNSFVTPGGRTIALISFERASTIGFFDITNVTAIKLVKYVTHPSLIAPEHISIIPAANSPSGKHLLVANGEGGSGASTQGLFLWEITITEPTTATPSPSKADVVVTSAFIVAILAIINVLVGA